MYHWCPAGTLNHHCNWLLALSPIYRGCFMTLGLCHTLNIVFLNVKNGVSGTINRFHFSYWFVKVIFLLYQTVHNVGWQERWDDYMTSDKIIKARFECMMSQLHGTIHAHWTTGGNLLIPEKVYFLEMRFLQDTNDMYNGKYLFDISTCCFSIQLIQSRYLQVSQRFESSEGMLWQRLDVIIFYEPEG